MRIKKQTVYMLYLFNQVLQESQYANFLNIERTLFISRYMILGLIMIYIIAVNNIAKRNSIIWFGTILFVLAINFVFFDGSTTVLGIVLFVIASRGIRLKKLFLATIISLCTAHIFVVLSCVSGILEDSVSIRYIGTATGNFFKGKYTRHSMGFVVTNQLPLAFMILYMFYIIYKKGNVTVLQHLFALLINILLFRLCGARIVFALCFPLIIATYFIKVYERKNLGVITNNNRVTSFVGGLLYMTPLILCIVSFLLVLLYKSDSEFSAYINEFFNNRIYFAYENIKHFGISLLGAGKTAGTTEAVQTVDNGYIIMFLQYGIIVGAMILGCWIYIGYVAVKLKNPYIILVVFLLAVENIINSHLTNYKMIPMFCILVNLKDPLIRGNKVSAQNKKQRSILCQ